MMADIFILAMVNIVIILERFGKQRKEVYSDRHRWKVINEISCADSLEMLFGDDRYLFCMGMGEDQLMYIDKREIEKPKNGKYF